MLSYPTAVVLTQEGFLPGKEVADLFAKEESLQAKRLQSLPGKEVM